MGLDSKKALENSRYELTVSVSAEDFSKAVDAEFKKNSKKITVQGFRKGKAPRHLIEKMYGEDVFYDDAINALLPDSFTAAAKEAGIVPVDRPEIDLVSCDKENGVVYTATVTVKPTVKVKKYKGIKAEKTVNTVTDEAIDDEINKMLDRSSRLVPVENRAAVDGDTAVIDFEGFLDGTAFEGGKGEQYSLTLGSGQFIPGFEEQIVGKNIGDEFDVNVTFPEEYHSEELSGKDVVFKVKLNELKEKEVPALDDEFAKESSEFDTVDELKADIRKRLEDEEKHRSEEETENSIIEKLIETMEGDIPEVMYENSVEDMVRDFEYRLRAQGMELSTYLKYVGMEEKDFRNTFREQAERQVKTRLSLESIVDAEKIEPSDEEVEAQYAKLAENYKTDVENVKKYIPLEDIKADLAVNKAIDFVRDNAVISEKKAK